MVYKLPPLPGSILYTMWHLLYLLLVSSFVKISDLMLFILHDFIATKSSHLMSCVCASEHSSSVYLSGFHALPCFSVLLCIQVFLLLCLSPFVNLHALLKWLVLSHPLLHVLKYCMLGILTVKMTCSIHIFYYVPFALHWPGLLVFHFYL